MSRKVMIALAAIAFVGAVAASTAADAQRSGFGGGMRAGGFAGGGLRGFAPAFRGGFTGPRFAGPRISGPRFVGTRFGGPRFVGPRHRRFAFVPGFRRHPVFARPPFRRFAHRRFVRHGFVFAAAPFFVGAVPYYYDDPCWVLDYTPWGPRYVYVCNDYEY
jgi:hypothetical protein